MRVDFREDAPPSLFDDPPVAVIAEPTLEDRFRAFHTAHPEVYEHLVLLARQVRAAGHARIGIATLYERLRWDYLVGDLGTDAEFKLNNSWRSRYARLIAEQCPDLADMFETRELRT